MEARAWGVKRVLVAHGIDTYDMIQAQVRYTNGSMATFESGWVYPNAFPIMVDSFISMVGEHGDLHFDRKRESLEMSTPERFTYPKTFLSADVFGTLRSAFPSCLDDFINAIRKDTTPAVAVRDGRKATAVLTAIYESLKTGANALDVLERDNSAVYRTIEDNGEKLMAGMRNLAERRSITIVVQGYGSIFYAGFPPDGAALPEGQAVYDYRSSLAMDQDLYTHFVSAMVDRGVRIIPRGNWFFSSAHSEADIDATLSAVDEVFADVIVQLRSGLVRV